MLRQFINIQHWLASDTTSDWQTRLQRDRDISLSNSEHYRQTAPEQILEWWRHIEQHYDVEDVGYKVVTLFNWTTLLTALIGVVLGASTALAVLHYDGSEPINVLIALSVLVVVPLLLLITSLFLPLVNSQSILGRLNLGGIVQSFIRTRLSHLEASFSFPLYGLENFLGWRLMGYSQLFGFAFALAALVILVLKVTLTDLAFAWGTTLNIESRVIHEIVSVVCSPWASWLPSAAPDEMLVAASQYYRLGDSADNVSASALTGWWKFLAASLLFYGLAVRALLFVFAKLKTKASLDQVFLNHPQSIALLERLNSAAITSHEENEAIENVAIPGNDLGGPSQSFDTIACIFSWQDASVSIKDSSSPIISIRESGDLTAHKKSRFASSLNGAEAVLVVSKGWEPPLLEFHDFLGALRELLGAGPGIIVMPVDDKGAPSPQHDTDVWRASLAKINDANLYCQ